MRIETQHGRGHAGTDGENVPEIERHDVGDEEVDVAEGVNGAAFAGGVSRAS